MGLPRVRTTTSAVNRTTHRIFGGHLPEFQRDNKQYAGDLYEKTDDKHLNDVPTYTFPKLPNKQFL